MAHKYVVFGAGRQGAAIAFDLVRNCDAASVTVADVDPCAVRRCVQRLRALLPQHERRIHEVCVDVCNAGAAANVARGATVVISAVPYRFNVELTDVAIAAGASFCDLGGNTDIVRHQLQRDRTAAAAGVSVVPDCGLAPGLGNILAAHAIAALDEADEVHVRCGGLPERPIGALGYKLVFNFQGLINEYSGVGEFLRDGQRLDVPALTELESIEFAPPLGRCEAAVTSGGTSTCPETFAGRVRTYDYKTVRYPGHFAIIRALFELGCFDESVRCRDGATIEPRPLLRRLFEERLEHPEVPDIVVLRVSATGRVCGKPRRLRYDLFDRHDEQTGFTAMERTTAYPTALVAHMQARRLIAPGAKPLELAVPLDRYMDELPTHGIEVTIESN